MAKNKTLSKQHCNNNLDNRGWINDIILSAESVDLIDMGISDESTTDTNAVHLVENLTSGENTVSDNECENIEVV